MPAEPLELSGARRRSLSVLLDDLHRARQEVGRLRSVPLSRDPLAEAHTTLLRAMERYTAALTACGLPTPWRLRDELRLERSIENRRNRSGP